MKNNRLIKLKNINYKVFAILFLLLLQCVTLTSCIKTTELNEKSIIQLIGVDRFEGEYNVIIQNFKPEGSGKIAFDPSKPNNIVIEEKGTTIGQALKLIRIHHGKDIFLGNNSIIVIGRKTAEEGISDVLNYFNNNYECRPNVGVIMGEGLASDIIKAQVADGPTPAIVLERVIEQYKSTGIIDSVELKDVIERLHTQGSEVHMPIVKISLDATNTPQFDVEKAAIFKGDKLVGEFNRGQTRGMRFFNDNLKQTNIVVEDTDKSKFFVSVSKSKTKVKVKIIDDIPHLYVETKMNGSVKEGIFPDKYGVELSDVEGIEKLCNEMVEAEMFKALSYTLREKKADALGVGRYIKKYCPDYWKQHVNEWDQIMPQVIYDLNAHVVMDTIGLDTNR